MVPVASENAAIVGPNADDKFRISTRRGGGELKVRQDDQVPPGAIFILHAFVEATANELTRPLRQCRILASRKPGRADRCVSIS